MSHFAKTELPRDVFEAICEAGDALREEIRLSNNERSKKALRGLHAALLFLAPENNRIPEKAIHEQPL